MKRLLLLAAMLFTVPAYGQDTLDLTAPLSATPPATKLRVTVLVLDWENHRVVGSLGEESYAVAAAGTNAGVLTVRTSNQVGSLTMTTGHTIVTGQKFNLAWALPTPGKRLNVLAGTVAGDVVPITGGRGDQLPPAATAVTMPTYTVSYPAKFQFDYAGDEADQILKQVNSNDFTATSLHKWFLQRLTKDKKFVGTTSGAPD